MSTGIKADNGVGLWGSDISFAAKTFDEYILVKVEV